MGERLTLAHFTRRHFCANLSGMPPAALSRGGLLIEPINQSEETANPALASVDFLVEVVMPFSRLPLRMQKKSTIVTGVLILLLLSILVGVVYVRPSASVREVNFTQLREMSDAGRARAVEISGEVITITGADGVLVRSVVTNAVAQH